MPSSTPATTLKALKKFGLSLPGTQPKSPWPGHDDVAVNNKTFAFMSVGAGALTISMKLPVTGKDAMQLPFAASTRYGLGKSGWVTFSVTDGATVGLETLKRWMMES